MFSARNATGQRVLDGFTGMKIKDGGFQPYFLTNHILSGQI